MQNATVTPPAPTGPDQAAPPGMKWHVLYRRRKGEEWQVLVETATGEEAWRAMCEHRASGEYRPKLVRVDLFDGASATAG